MSAVNIQNLHPGETCRIPVSQPQGGQKKHRPVSEVRKMHQLLLPPTFIEERME